MLVVEHRAFDDSRENFPPLMAERNFGRLCPSRTETEQPRQLSAVFQTSARFQSESAGNLLPRTYEPLFGSRFDCVFATIDDFHMLHQGRRHGFGAPDGGQAKNSRCDKREDGRCAAVWSACSSHIACISSKQKGRLKTETALPPLFRRPSTVFIGSTL